MYIYIYACMYEVEESKQESSEHKNTDFHKYKS